MVNMVITVRITGLKEVGRTMDKLKYLRKHIDKEGSSAIQEIAKWIKNDARVRAPFKTGKLRKGIKSKVKDEKHIVITSTVKSTKGVEYGVLQEFGFRHYKSGKFVRNPYIEPAINVVRSKIPKLTQDHIRIGIKKTFGD